MKIRVLLVDDSALVRKILHDRLTEHADIDIVGTAPDPYAARDLIVHLKPDVVLLDIEMPRMDGLTFLRRLMHYHPIPVIIVSSITPKGSAKALEALTLGAVDVVCKPSTEYNVGNLTRRLSDSIRTAATIQIKQLRNVPEDSVGKRPVNFTPGKNIIALGASTGGTRALEIILKQFPVNAPGTVVVQHMPRFFTQAFADRLNSLCEVEVREACDGDVLSNGLILIAPGDTHMVLRKKGTGYAVELRDGELVHHQRPSVEVLFRSVAQCAGKQAVGALLTGMGADGAEGLLAMRNAGAHTIAQDEASSVVYGMPAVAARIGAACAIKPLQDIARCILAHV